MTFVMEPGGPVGDVSWYLLSGSSPLAVRPGAAPMPGLHVGLLLADLEHPLAEGTGPVGVCGPIECFAALIACIERSAHNAGFAEALGAATDQARASIAEAVKGQGGRG